MSAEVAAFDRERLRKLERLATGLFDVRVPDRTVQREAATIAAHALALIRREVGWAEQRWSERRAAR
jgi:hypothetical protein